MKIRDKMRYMQLRTTAQDCLSLNWALPRAAAPPLPAPLRYEIHTFEDGEHVFASALLFQFSGLHHRSLPFLRVAYPQLSLRLYVIDHQSRPAALLLRLLVPPWVAPFARVLGRQPSEAAHFRYPAIDTASGGQNGGGSLRRDEIWSWSVECGRRLEVTGKLSSPITRSDQRLGSWDETLAYFRYRRRVYAIWNQRLRALNTSYPASDVLPLEVEIGEIGLIAECLRGVDESALLRPHSAWLCPEIPFEFEYLSRFHLPLARQRQPAAEGC